MWVNVIPELVVLRKHESGFSSIKHRTVVHTKKTPTLEDPLLPAAELDEHSGLFSCPEVGCKKTFLRQSSIMRHLDCDKHEFVLERATVCVKAAIKYADLLEGQGVTAVPALRSTTVSTRGSTKLKMGWALKLGELTKQKADPASVVR